MRITHLFILGLIALSVVGCQSKSKETSNNTANNFVPIEEVKINNDLLEGIWISNNSSLNMTFKNGHYYDPIETECQFIYRINSDSLIIDNINWGRQTFRILKLSDDTLKIRLIRQEIFEDNLNEEVYDDEERVYWRDRSLY